MWMGENVRFERLSREHYQQNSYFATFEKVPRVTLLNLRTFLLIYLGKQRESATMTTIPKEMATFQIGHPKLWMTPSPHIAEPPLLSGAPAEELAVCAKQRKAQAPVAPRW